MDIFNGTAVALVTPCSGDGIIYSSVQKLIKRVTEGGADALVALGSTGEASTLDDKLKFDFLRYVRSLSSLPLIVGAGGNDTANVVRVCDKAQEYGINALLIVTPFYNKCTQQGAYEHYRFIAERVSSPIIVYNVPARTGFDLLPDTMREIAKLPNIAAIKEASGNMSHIAECLSFGITVYSGDDALTAPAMCLGAKGVISVAANVAPSLVSRMTTMALCGNLAKAGALQLKLLPLIKALFCEVNPIPVRAALEMLDIPVGKPRLPMTELTEQNKIKLRVALEELKLL